MAPFPVTAPRGDLVPRPHALAAAVASCAAAGLSGSTSASNQPASVQAVVQLGRHAAEDARSAVETAARSPRRARRLLARSSRRLRYAHTLAGLVRADQHATSVPATAPLAEHSADVARHAADLACGRRGRLGGRAVKTLRRSADLQDQMGFALASFRFAGSLTQLHQALQIAVDAQDQLLTALTVVSASEQVSPRRRRALESARQPAQEARDALVTALIQVRIAVTADVHQQATTNGAAAEGSEADETSAPEDDTADPGLDDAGH